MAYLNAFADGHDHMMHFIRMFAAGLPLPRVPTFVGTGTGAVTKFTTWPGAVPETWTITCTTAPGALAVYPHGTNMDFDDPNQAAGQLDGWSQWDTRPVFQWSAGSADSGANKAAPTALDGYDGCASYQRINLITDGVPVADIDRNAAQLYYHAMRNNFGTNAGDIGHTEFHFIDAGLNTLQVSTSPEWKNLNGWSPEEQRITIPIGTRYIDIVIVGELKSGSSLAVYFDKITLQTEINPAVFSVVGSVSGNVGNAGVHDSIQYFGNISFVLDNPFLDFVNGDAFTVIVDANTIPSTSQWSVNRATYFSATGNTGGEVFLQGQGSSGTDAIQIQMRGNSYGIVRNILLGGSTGFDDNMDFYNQPGAPPVDDETFYRPQLAIHDSSMEFWLMVNPRRIMAVVKVGAYYAHLYLGFLKTYYTPAQYPYPLIVGGNQMNTPNNSPESSDVSAYNRAYWDCCVNTYGTDSSPLYLRKITGAWQNFWNRQANITHTESEANSHIRTGVYPWWAEMITGLTKNLDESFPMFPACLHEDDNRGGTAIYGEFEGLYGVPGKGTVVEDTITYDGDTYKIFQNNSYSGDGDYCAVKLA